MRARGLDLRLVPPALAAWATAGILLARPSAGMLWAAASAAAAALTVLIALASARSRSVAGVVVITLAAVGLAAAATATAGAARHPAALDAGVVGHAATIEATVTSGPRTAAGNQFGGGDRVSFRVTADSVQAGESRVVGRMPALVYADRRTPEPQIGERVRLTGRAKPTSTEENVALIVYADGWSSTAPPPAWLAWADGLRARFAAATARLPGDGGSLLPGLAIGDVTRVGPELDADMKASSLSHLTAVSGSNCAVIVAGLLAIATLLGLPRLWRVGLALAGLAGFVILVTPGASVLRAAVMASIVVLGTALGRPGRAVPALALAVLVLLVQNPWLSRDYGFALSVAATAALLVLAPPLAERLARWLPRWLAIGLSVPLAAQLACQPVLVLLNPTLPLYGVVANLLAEPAAPVATVSGLIGCLLIPLSPQLAAPLLWFAWAPSAWIAGIARATTSLPGSALPWPAGFFGFALAAMLTAAVVVLVARPRSVGGRRVRRAVGGASAALIVCALALQAGPAIAERAGMPRNWVVGLCDIGQGDAIVVRDGASYALIDTGREPQALMACLHRLGIRQLALLVLTHYDIDHIGAVGAVADMARTAVVGTPPPGDIVAQRWLDELRDQHVPVHLATRGDAGTVGSLRWRVLWPDGAHPKLTTSNEGAVTIEIEGAGIRMLFLADLDEKAQDALISDGDLPSVDIVKVSHHGSADQSERLYGLLHARLALISCGWGNSYGHPTSKALQLLRSAGTQVARTDLEGMVLVTAHDGALGLWTEKKATEAALWTPAKR